MKQEPHIVYTYIFILTTVESWQNRPISTPQNSLLIWASILSVLNCSLTVNAESYIHYDIFTSNFYSLREFFLGSQPLNPYSLYDSSFNLNHPTLDSLHFSESLNAKNNYSVILNSGKHVAAFFLEWIYFNH